ncbi:hypothetical protein RAB80_015374 [Fusarium oxysporum f. sp. vasinfectum]|nr:hypothetical protein RAB80_015374 [Fusarium oxysporum f. sp. vasinfectum]
MSSASIRRWLRDIPDHNISKDHDLERPSKRPRYQHPVTPEPSEDCFFAEMPPSLKLDARGIEFRDLVLFNDKPAELEDLLDAIDLVMEGKGIVSTLQQDALVSASKSSKAFKWAARGGDYFSEDRDAIRYMPSPEDVIDFSIYIEPGNDLSRSAKDAISRCQRDLPESVFNFTDAALLAYRPIAFSIETKKPSAGFDGAKLQLGIWQNAHWIFLCYLA